MIGKLLILTGICLFAAPPCCLGQMQRNFPNSDESGLFDRGVLWEIVNYCVDTNDSVAAYCEKCPSPLLPLLAKCNGVPHGDLTAVCRNTTQVWNKTSEFVAMRDYKMCGCPAGFVHGLALSRHKITGAEDPRRPAGLWQFAWDEAVKKINDKEEIVLVTNSRRYRSQDQIHIHLVRLAPGARQRLLALNPIFIKNLDETWEAAERHASPLTLEDGRHGVAVIYDAATDGFFVVAAIAMLEKTYSVYACKDQE